MLRRYIQQELASYLKIMPVVLLTGARQSGKTTIARSIEKEKGYSWVTFDDELSLANAARDPSGWLSGVQKPVVIDEVQRLPEIFLSIKRDVDQNRQVGRYLLTGSANPLFLPRVGDSLAGRMGIVPLFPFSQVEIKQGSGIILSHLFQEEIPRISLPPFSKKDLYPLFLQGGFPTVQSFTDLQDTRRWISSYLQTMLERDVRDIANIEGLRDFPRLFRLLATRSGNLLNTSDLSRTLGMVNMTVHRYLRLLEALYFVYLLPAWYSNLGKRMIKSPKLHLCDTGIMAQLLDIDTNRLQQNDALTGQFLETFVFTELLKQKSWSSTPFELYHFRDGDREVDFVLEKDDGSIIGIEVKSARHLTGDDLKGLHHLKELAKSRFKRGIVLHLGESIEQMAPDMWSFPIQALWQ